MSTTRTIYIRGIAPFVNEHWYPTPSGALLTMHENLDARFTSPTWSTFVQTDDIHIYMIWGNVHAIFVDFAADLACYVPSRGSFLE